MGFLYWYMRQIYCIKNKITDYVYIGQSINLSKRTYQHKLSLKNNKHHCQHLQNAWNKYGEQAFEFYSIVDCDTIEEAELLEKFFIHWFAELKLAYNPIWRHGLRGEVSEETRNKLREKALESNRKPPSRKGIPMSKEAIDKRKETLLANPKPKKQKLCDCGEEINLWATYCKECLSKRKSEQRKATILTKETKERLRSLRIGRVSSKESREKISSALRGKSPTNLKDIQAMRCKEFNLKGPDGITYTGKGISGFAKAYNLSRHKLGKLINGEIEEYKGWRRE